MAAKFLRLCDGVKTIAGSGVRQTEKFWQENPKKKSEQQ
jgi:hypothetical protein